MRAFRSELVDRVRAGGNSWKFPGGELLLPSVFGFCRGVERALAMLARAVNEHRFSGTRLVLFGEIIHNPWVNDYFHRRGVRILSGEQRGRVKEFVRGDDCAVIPAFGVPLPIERRLREIGCEIVDTSCGDVRRLWAWAEQAVSDGFAVMIFGRARHDETVVTKSRLADAGGRYVVVGDLDQADLFCAMITGDRPAGDFRAVFDDEATNAESLAPFVRLAQASQTTMLYDDTMELRERIRRAYLRRFGSGEVDRRLRFQPTVCRATQQRQRAAVELCRSQPDLAIVVGGFGSSNTRHLYDIARTHSPAYFIESAEDIRSRGELRCFDVARQVETMSSDWLPDRRPLRIAVLAGASSPEIVVGQILERLAALLE